MLLSDFSDFFWRFPTVKKSDYFFDFSFFFFDFLSFFPFSTSHQSQVSLLFMTEVVPLRFDYGGILILLENHFDVLETILEFLNPHDLNTLARVSSLWRQLATQERLWKKLAVIEYGRSPRGCEPLKFHWQLLFFLLSF